MAISFFKYYTYLSVIGLFLLMCRKDRHLIYDDLMNLVLRGNFLLTAFNLILLFLTLPMTIPFSVINITKK